jgi:arginine/lysine/ornithine decarboxylase
MEDLFEKLLEYGSTDFYPFHMPGHKRRPLTAEKTYSIDITEVDGFDDLHHPNGILRELEETAAKLYQTVETKLLVNGSTCGLLAAISACTTCGGKILVARNCHKSVYNGILLRGLQAVYLYPTTEPEFGLCGSISPESVKEALAANPDVQAVVLTSPTYDGILSDIEKISRIVHQYGLPLIVDEAHGAHLPFSGGFLPASALEGGADLVIHSLHKTLPSLTQTALLHINSQRPEREKIQKYLSVYQSSSPSYILMAGIGSCIKWLQDASAEAFAAYEKRLCFWRGAYRELLGRDGVIRLVEYSNEKSVSGEAVPVYAYDESKLLFSVKEGGRTGEAFYQILLEKYHIQLEMAAGSYVLALSSVCDREEGFKRLYEALEALQKEWRGAPIGKSIRQEMYQPLPKARKYLELWEAEEKPKTLVKLEESRGHISASALYVYPPGIPFLLPGEEITAEILSHIRRMQACGLKVEGLENTDKICVLVMKKM